MVLGKCDCINQHTLVYCALLLFCFVVQAMASIIHIIIYNIMDCGALCSDMLCCVLMCRVLSCFVVFCRVCRRVV